MSGQISNDHPIRDLFSCVVSRAFQRDLSLAEPELSSYVADLLVEFTSAERIFSIRDVAGTRLEQVGEMLLEGDIALNATSFDREREVHKHIGDFTLFWAGLYPGMLGRLRAPDRRDHLVDYVAQGRRSYAIASTFNHGSYAREAPVLRKLSSSFESCLRGLNSVRRELETYASAESRAACRLLDA